MSFTLEFFCVLGRKRLIPTAGPDQAYRNESVLVLKLAQIADKLSLKSIGAGRGG